MFFANQTCSYCSNIATAFGLSAGKKLCVCDTHLPELRKKKIVASDIEGISFISTVSDIAIFDRRKKETERIRGYLESLRTKVEEEKRTAEENIERVKRRLLEVAEAAANEALWKLQCKYQQIVTEITDAKQTTFDYLQSHSSHLPAEWSEIASSASPVLPSLLRTSIKSPDFAYAQRLWSLFSIPDKPSLSSAISGIPGFLQKSSIVVKIADRIVASRQKDDLESAIFDLSSAQGTSMDAEMGSTLARLNSALETVELCEKGEIAALFAHGWTENAVKALANDLFQAGKARLYEENYDQSGNLTTAALSIVLNRFPDAVLTAKVLLQHAKIRHFTKAGKEPDASTALSMALDIALKKEGVGSALAIDVYASLSAVATDSQQYPASQLHLDKGLALSSSFPQSLETAHLYRSFAHYYSKTNPQQALEWDRKAADLVHAATPWEGILSQYNLGLSLRKSTRPGEAKAAFQAGTEIVPPFPITVRCWIRLAEELGKVGMTAEAEEAVGKAADIGTRLFPWAKSTNEAKSLLEKVRKQRGGLRK